MIQCFKLFQPDTVWHNTQGHAWSKVIGQKILHIPCSSRNILLRGLLRKHIKCKLHSLQVDSGEGGRQSKMAANSKSHAISQMAYSEADGNLSAVWETAYSVKRLKCNIILILRIVFNHQHTSSHLIYNYLTIFPFYQNPGSICKTIGFCQSRMDIPDMTEILSEVAIKMIVVSAFNYSINLVQVLQVYLWESFMSSKTVCDVIASSVARFEWMYCSTNLEVTSFHY